MDSLRFLRDATNASFASDKLSDCMDSIAALVECKLSGKCAISSRDATGAWTFVSGAQDLFDEKIASLSQLPAEDAGVHIAPIRWSGHTVGALIVRTAPGTFDDEHKALLEEVASRCAEAMEFQRLRARMALVYEAGEALTESIDVGANLSKFARRLVPSFADFCSLSTKNGNLEASESFPARLAAGVKDRLPGWHAEAQRGNLVSTYLDGPGHSVLIAPMMTREGLVGSLVVGRSIRREKFSPDDIQVAREIASRMAQALANGRLLAIAERERAESMAAAEAARGSEARARRSNDEWRQFSFVASHDLQEPLRTILIYSELLSRRYQGQLEGEGEMFLGNIVTYAARMRDLINDLLLYSHLPSGRERPLESVDSLAILQTALYSLQSQVEMSAAQVTYDGLPKVMASGDLVLVFSNLVANAIKYRSSEPPRIRVAAEVRGQEWEFSVADNGLGIKPEYADRIFGIFKRLHGREIPGTGLGLAIAKKVVESYGGRIWVDSNEGEGSTFRFTIPI